MIEQITIKNFKSFKDVTLKLGPLNIFIGTNASGKSNFFDALRVLQGIGYGFTLSEILDGKPKSATSEVWEGIRGGSAGVPFAFDDADKPTVFRVTGRLPDRNNSGFEFTIALSARDAYLHEECLSVSEEAIYDSSPEHNIAPGPSFSVRYYDGVERQPPCGTVRIEGNRPALTQMTRQRLWRRMPARSELAERVTRVLGDMQRIDPSPSLLRAYSQAYEIKRMGEHGENFAALIRMICNDPETKEAYLSWLRELRPHDVDDVGILKGALGEPMVMMKERNREWPAPSLSDGTLRFAALAVVFFQPDMPGILTIEEIENGIHASRLRLLVELMRSHAVAGKTQVMLTTHSPVVLAWLKPEEYATTFYCRRDEETGESQITPLADIPRFKEIVSKQPISDLFAEGWLEEAL
jgi:predicted ATPase